MKNVKDDHGKVRASTLLLALSFVCMLTWMYDLFVWQTKGEIVRWEEGKKWQAKMEKVKNSLKEKERENESLSKQLSTLKDLYGRSVCTSYWTLHTVFLDLDFCIFDRLNQLKAPIGSSEHLVPNNGSRDWSLQSWKHKTTSHTLDLQPEGKNRGHKGAGKLLWADWPTERAIQLLGADKKDHYNIPQPAGKSINSLFYLTTTNTIFNVLLYDTKKSCNSHIWEAENENIWLFCLRN